jgi:hypothetical protein
MDTDATSAAAESATISESIRLRLHKAALQRNLRSAAVVGFAISGGLISSAWLAVTAGGTFLALSAWRYKQLRDPAAAGQNRSEISSF